MNENGVFGPDRTHGILSTANAGCRCTPCRVARQSYDRGRRITEQVRTHKQKPFAWMTDAACSNHPNPQWWWAWESVHKYGQHNAEQMTEAAIKICRTCTVLDECRSYAYMNPKEEGGVWAGETAKERGGRRRRKGKVA